MSTNHLLVWNAHGLNNRARRNVVRDVAEQQRASIVCLQETKVANLSASMNADLTGAGFDFACLPAIGVAGGAVTSWRRDLWSVSSSCVRRFSVTVKLSPADGHAEPWWLTNVYGPATRAGKPDFFQELRDIHASCPNAWLVCGDFNVIYLASDKKSGRLHRGLMRRFRSLIDDLQLEELTLSGRLFTWSNGRDQPTLERLDRRSPQLSGSSATRVTSSAASPRTAPTTLLSSWCSTLNLGRDHASASTRTGPRLTAAWTPSAWLGGHPTPTTG